MREGSGPEHVRLVLPGRRATSLFVPLGGADAGPDYRPGCPPGHLCGIALRRLLRRRRRLAGKTDRHSARLGNCPVRPPDRPGARGASFAFAPAIAERFDRLTQEIPAAVESLRSRLEEYAWGEELLRRATPGALMSNGGEGTAAAAVTTTFGALGNFVIMLFVGLHVALDPVTYRKGLVSVFAASLRPSAEEMVRKATATLKNWLVAQLMAMRSSGR